MTTNTLTDKQRELLAENAARAWDYTDVNYILSEEPKVFFIYWDEAD